MPSMEMIENLSASLSCVFAFFSRPADLISISPPELHFEMLSGPEQLSFGAHHAARAALGMSQRIVTKVIVWEPETRFVDEQR